MPNLCVIAANVVVLTLGEGDFSLAWKHSVTQDYWVEHWQISEAGLKVQSAEVSGPGAGLEIPDHAIRQDKGWSYTLNLPKQKSVYLAASGATKTGWRLCQDDQCHDIGERASAPLELTLCP